MMDRNVVSVLARNSLGLSPSQAGHRESFDNSDFIHRLKKQITLGGHTGCVNTICWNKTGDLLLSGSDDCLLNVYNVWQEKLLLSVHSGHRSNILSAAFLPSNSDIKIVSCSSDGVVIFNDTADAESHGCHSFQCHVGAAYKVLSLNDEPDMFLSCGEDGTVREFDLRIKTHCHCRRNGCREDVVINNGHAVSSVTINPVMHHHLALGSGDGLIKLFDRRMLTRPADCGRNAMNGLLCQFKPNGLEIGDRTRATSLQYNTRGTELLVSYCSDYIYLYSMCGETGDENRALNAEDSAASGFVEPQAKRLRLRGDWSDTGPDARPLTEVPTGEQRTESVVMQRVSSLVSGLLENTFQNRRDSHGEETGTTTRQQSRQVSGIREEPSRMGDAGVVCREPDASQRHNAATRIQRFIRNRNRNKMPPSGVAWEHLQPKLLMCYKGHRNSRTMIQQATFWGESYVMSGSDCGRVFIWHRSTGRLAAFFVADAHVVNCVQPHPFTQALATSGIDYNVKIWTPTSVEPLSIDDADEVIRRNQVMLAESKNFISVPNSFMLRLLLSIGNAQRRRQEPGRRDSEND